MGKIKIIPVDFDKYLVNHKHISLQQYIGSGKSTSVVLYIKQHYNEKRFLYVAPTIALLNEMRGKIIRNVLCSKDDIFIWSSEHAHDSPENIYRKCNEAKIVMMTYTRFLTEVPENFGFTENDTAFVDEFDEPIASFKLSNMLRNLMVSNKDICPKDKFISSPLNSLGIKTDFQFLITCEPQNTIKETRLKELIYENLPKGLPYNKVDDIVTVNIFDLWKNMNIVRLDATAQETSFLFPGFEVVEKEGARVDKSSDLITGYKLWLPVNPTKTYIRSLTEEQLKKFIYSILDNIPFEKYENIYMTTFKFLIENENSYIIQYLKNKYPDYNINVNQGAEVVQEHATKTNNAFRIKSYTMKNINIFNYGRMRGLNNSLCCDATVQLGAFRLGKEEEATHVAYCQNAGTVYDQDGFTVANIVQENRARNRVGQPIDSYIVLDNEADMAFERYRPYLYNKYKIIDTNIEEFVDNKEYRFTDNDKKMMSLSSRYEIIDENVLMDEFGYEKLAPSNSRFMLYLKALLKNRKDIVWKIFDKDKYIDENEIIDLYKNQKIAYLKNTSVR